MPELEEESVLACAEKLAFDTAREAQAAAITLQYQRGISLKIYQCHDCHLWHLSSNTNDL